MEKLIKACVSILPKPLQEIYYKYEEKWLYIIFGGLTTVVSIVTKLLLFALVPGEPKWESTAGVVFSWICAVTFAFFTNKKYVFKNETNTSSEFWKVFFSFYGARLATLGMKRLSSLCLLTGSESTERSSRSSVRYLSSSQTTFSANFWFSKRKRVRRAANDPKN